METISIAAPTDIAMMFIPCGLEHLTTTSPSRGPGVRAVMAWSGSRLEQVDHHAGGCTGKERTPLARGYGYPTEVRGVWWLPSLPRRCVGLLQFGIFRTRPQGASWSSTTNVMLGQILDAISQPFGGAISMFSSLLCAFHLSQPPTRNRTCFRE